MEMFQRKYWNKNKNKKCNDNYSPLYTNTSSIKKKKKLSFRKMLHAYCHINKRTRSYF